MLGGSERFAYLAPPPQPPSSGARSVNAALLGLSGRTGGSTPAVAGADKAPEAAAVSPLGPALQHLVLYGSGDVAQVRGMSLCFVCMICARVSKARRALTTVHEYALLVS
jgi:hypothetical protein